MTEVVEHHVDDPPHMQEVIDAFIFATHNPGFVNHDFMLFVEYKPNHRVFTAKAPGWELEFKKNTRGGTSTPTISGNSNDAAMKFFTDAETLFEAVKEWRAQPTQILFELSLSYEDTNWEKQEYYTILLKTDQGKLYDYFDKENDVEVVQDIEEFGVLDFTGSGDPMWKFGYHSGEISRENTPTVISRFRAEFTKHGFECGETIHSDETSDDEPEWAAVLTHSC